jgi:cytochrome P450
MDSTINIPSHVAPDRVFDLDIYADPRVSDDVQASYARMLEGAPDVFWTPRNGGHWIVRRYEAIQAVVNDYENFSAREMQIPRVPDPPYMIPLNVDPPANVPYRQALMPMFSPKAVRDMEPKLRHWAVKLIEEVVAKGECDFIEDISSRFPVSVFMELMGMDLGRLREFRAIADGFFNSHDSASIEKWSAVILGEMQALIEARAKTPGSDLVSHLLTTDVGGRKLTKEEVLAMCFVLFLGGMDTVTNLTGFAFQHLAGDPKLQRLLAETPERIPDFVDEALRCFSVINTPRLVAKDCEKFGVRFKAGEMVLNMLTIAGFDETVNPKPYEFDIDRKESHHLTFSAGPHLCVGQILARAEMRILTEEWVKRVPSFSAKPGKPHGFRIGTVTALHALPLTWAPAHAVAAE